MAAALLHTVIASTEHFAGLIDKRRKAYEILQFLSNCPNETKPAIATVPGRTKFKCSATKLANSRSALHMLDVSSQQDHSQTDRWLLKRVM